MTTTQQPAPACPECGAAMVLKQTTRFRYPKTGKPRLFLACSTWPTCPGTHGCHPDGSPCGIPADKATKQARMQAHAWFDALWQSGRMTRRAAYRVMQRLMDMTEEEAHIARFTRDQCLLLMVRLANSEHADLMPTGAAPFSA